MKRRAVLFIAWGEKYIKEVYRCIKESRQFIGQYHLILITDEETNTDLVTPYITQVIRARFTQSGLLRKTEVAKFLPRQYDSYLLLDSDTVVIKDISLGFSKAETHGIAACPAPHYSLESFWGFDRIMERAGVPRLGQLQYNTGVIFFGNQPEVKEVFSKWGTLASEHSDFTNDQPFFSLAAEILNFNPYTLSISFNYRAFGDAISGDVRIWHSHGKMPPEINQYSVTWPPRRAWPGRIELSSNKRKNLLSRAEKRLTALKNLWSTRIH